MTKQTPPDEEVLSLFLSSAEKLQAQVENLPEADLDLSRESGSWTIRQIVHHVADDCDVWSMCIKKAIATPGTLVRFEGFPGNEAWAEALDFDKREIGSAIHLISAHRHYLAQLLRHFSHAWDRSVRLANAEGEIIREMSVREMVKMLADHMQEHVERIERILSEKTAG
ncbi:MAG: hypothetical protein GXP39_10970 [Chloroflexi bacterium]|nr:hypothetical protein [Chloroflexota bacterium]